MTYAAIWLFGISVGAMPIPPGADINCTGMIAIMADDTEAAFAGQPFGLAIGNGTITRKGDWSYSCETSVPEIGLEKQAG